MLCLIAQSCLTLCDPMDRSPPGSSVHGDSPGKNTGLGCHACLQGIFPIQGLNRGLLHSRWILYHLSRQRSPRILEWVTYPFSRGSSQPRNLTGVSYIAGRFFTSWATREQVGIQPTSVPVCLNSQSSLFLIHALIQQMFTEHLLLLLLLSHFSRVRLCATP